MLVTIYNMKNLCRKDNNSMWAWSMHKGIFFRNWSRPLDSIGQA